MMNLTKLAASGALALALTASSLNVAPASAGDRGAGLAIGLATGLIVGGILLEANRHHRPHPQVYFNSGYDPYNADYYSNNYDYQQPACYLGPQKVRYVQQCREGRFGETHCWNVKQYFREQICN